MNTFTSSIIALVGITTALSYTDSFTLTSKSTTTFPPFTPKFIIALVCISICYTVDSFTLTSKSSITFSPFHTPKRVIKVLPPLHLADELQNEPIAVSINTTLTDDNTEKLFAWIKCAFDASYQRESTAERQLICSLASY